MGTMKGKKLHDGKEKEGRMGKNISAVNYKTLFSKNFE